MPSKINYTKNQIVNNLVFLKEVDPIIYSNGNRVRRAIFQCYCNNVFITSINSVRNNHTKSCGCYKIKMIKKANSKHGYSQHPLYRVFKDMKKRCYDKNAINYNTYGKRGIKICIEWLNNSNEFIDWALKNGWKKGLQIDRINNNGNYESSNCRFVTPAENIQNSRNAKLKKHEVKFIKKSKLKNKELANIYSIKPAAINRIKKNISWKNV